MGGAQSSLVRSGHETMQLSEKMTSRIRSEFRYSLGVKLEPEDHELSTIEQNYYGGNERCKLEMLLPMIESSC